MPPDLLKLILFKKQILIGGTLLYDDISKKIKIKKNGKTIVFLKPAC